MKISYLDFEKPISELEAQTQKLTETHEKNKNLDISKELSQLEGKTEKLLHEIYDNLNAWQISQVSRHPQRPYTLDYIEKLFTDFEELHGDRAFADDPAIVGGLASFEGIPVMVIGHQKGRDVKERQFRNFGMPKPEGYRKALRLYRLAEKFNVPIVTLIDTPGAYPGLEAEQNGQAEAIARNLFEMVNMKVPVICIIIGEGASGGALGIGIGDKVVMLENTWYTVISPESCSSILWRTWNNKELAAEQLKLTSEDMKGFDLVDDVLKEPIGGAHARPDEMAAIVKDYLVKTIANLQSLDAETRIQQRIDKFSKMGFYDEVPTA